MTKYIIKPTYSLTQSHTPFLLTRQFNAYRPKKDQNFIENSTHLYWKTVETKATVMFLYTKVIIN